jgi:hypothetical protein
MFCELPSTVWMTFFCSTHRNHGCHQSFAFQAAEAAFVPVAGAFTLPAGPPGG